MAKYNLNFNLHNVSKEEEALVMAYNDMISFGKLFFNDDSIFYSRLYSDDKNNDIARNSMNKLNNI